MNTLYAMLRGALGLAILALVIAGCDSADPGEDDVGEEEVISNVTITLTDDADASTFSAEAVFDEAGVKQSAETIALESGTTYTGEIELRNRFEDEDITEEIREESEEHQFFYVVQGDLSGAVTVTITDTDDNDRPVGLRFTVAVAEDVSETGELRVVLGHYGERPKQDDETIADIPETDIDFTYPLVVE